MQTAKSTLKFKVPVSILTPLPKKQVVVFDKQVVQNKPANTKLTKDIKPHASSSTKAQESKAAKEQIKAEKAKALAKAQKEALKAKLTRWKIEYKQILKLLQSKYPLCFSIPAKPLAIGIHKEIIDAEKEHFSNQQIRRFFKRYCSDRGYKKLLIEGKQRFNLNGTPASLVTKEEVPPKTDKSFKSKKS
ncbi:MAG: ProQ/FinO family protein [Rickettsia endosymbiont of Ixodes persulcatus]|nr:ProQ/FinO family protein [Rickettsia endosymbiont of Ixodes persulcatus]MCZ6913543.1 ProQ/FinO family protein [Rickettsia endosymbiont of Ixodes persulcatus]MCZ6920138.1 ProQ/FinO family protein [Rickettsia endosymbiont of Ixodes persulcatus]MCZ6924063.1 ProQ/FinO family protein [Rickettsia endosymbiont of Ixodes persulcatus]